MAVSLDLTQSGSGSTVIHASSGDTVTIRVKEANCPALANAIAGLNALTNVTGVSIAANYSAGVTAASLVQSGSGSTQISAASGDTVTLELAATVENDILASANAYLQGLTPPTGVNFAINTAGSAS